MRIGFFSETYAPDINGIITSMKTFKEELERAGHQVYIFAPDTAFYGEGKQPRKDDEILFRSFAYPYYESIRIALPFKRGFMERVRELKLDLIHSHTPFSMGYLAEKVALAEGIPHVHTYHTAYPEYVKHYFPRPRSLAIVAAKKYTAYFCNKVAQVIAPSPGIKENLLSYGVTSPIRVLSTGVDRSVFDSKETSAQDAQAFRARFRIPEHAPVLVTVARMGYEKSVDYLLNVFKEVLVTQPDAHYLVVGDGPAKAPLEAQARAMGIADRTHFTGFIYDRAEVARAYACADAFMFASKTETQCLTLLEAASVGLPLVARYDKPLETALVAGENGFYEEDESAFAARVCAILQDPALAARMGEASRRVASRQGSAERASELLLVYERAIISSKAQRALEAPRFVDDDLLAQEVSF